PVAAGDKKCYLPFRTGICSAIQRAVLRIGTTAIATSDEFGKYSTIKRQFKTNEEKQLKDFTTKGTMDGMEGDNSNDGFYQPCNVDWTGGAKVGVVPPPIQLTTSETECPVFTIKISELFPMMRNVQLPLYLIHEPVSIELSWKKQPTGAGFVGNIACFESGYAGDTSISIGQTNVKFLADYLTYDDDRMEEAAKQVMSDTGMVVPYEDLILTSTSTPAVVPAPTGAVVVPQSVNRELGLSGKVVRSIVSMDSKSQNNLFLGRYASHGYNVADAYNVRINDAVKYNRPVVRESYKQSQLAQVFSADLNVLNCEYSTNQLTNKQLGNHTINNQLMTDATVAGHTVRGSFEGHQHFMGIDLTTSPYNIMGVGTLVGQKPISIDRTINRTAENNIERFVSYWAVVERQFVLRAGQVQVSA
ncbi:MAG: hypothetical protein H8E55_66765, partial [Pelagibacterales bacterium]|nr:hypothetical protein [Pelagibacterales bacterium]